MKESENPFEDIEIANQWIKTVENEKGTIRDKEINPGLSEWINKINPETVLDIGCGQGICSTKLGKENLKYIGIDPSQTLIDRANELYKTENREFIVGNAYNIPLNDNSIDACFAITVWFHLENLDKALKEIARILKKGGNFMSVTADPNSYDVWKTHYEDVEDKEKMFIGKAKVLLNPEESNHSYSSISRNTFYKHTLQEIVDSLESSGLILNKIEKIGFLPIHPGRNLFIRVFGHKA